MSISALLLAFSLSASTVASEPRGCSVRSPLPGSDATPTYRVLDAPCLEELVEQLRYELSSNLEIVSFQVTHGAWQVSGISSNHLDNRVVGKKRRYAENVLFETRFSREPYILTRTVDLELVGSCETITVSKRPITPGGFRHSVQTDSFCGLEMISSEWIAFVVEPAESAATIARKWLDGPIGDAEWRKLNRQGL